MVTGLMIAKGFNVDMNNFETRNGEVDISGNIPSPDGQVGAGVNMAKSTSTKKQISGERVRMLCSLINF